MDATANFPYEWSPLRVFVVWHPAFAEGKGLADSLYAWFGGSDRELHRNGLGVPVHPWTTLDADQVPPPPPRATQDITVVIPLIDAEFAGRSAWRQWVDDLFAPQGSSTPSRLVLLPWAVHTAAVHIGPVSRSQLAGSGPCEPPTLNRLATEACALELLKEAGPPASREPSAPLGELHIFISYARRDGRDIALEVRRILQDFGHIRAFLDELDISPGHDWHGRLTQALDSGAAMVAVVTDTYASRPWCREELRTFREPRPTESPGRWWLPPVYILDNLGGRSTRSMFEVGSAPAARWAPERAGDLVDQLTREILMGAQQRARSRHIEVEPDSSSVVVNWVPDTWTVLTLSRRVPVLKEIVYPGDGLPTVEMRRLSDAFQPIRFTSFEEALHRRGDRTDEAGEGGDKQKPHQVVALSISDPPSAELTARGVSALHLDDTVLRVGRLLLRSGLDIAYGGRPKDGFTAGLQQDSGTVVLRPRLVNYLGWPWAERLTPAQVADDLGVCRYVKVPAPWAPSPVPERPDPGHLVKASTETRQAIASGSHLDLDGRSVGPRIAQVVFGGQLSGYQGVLPGILEEAMIARENGLGLFVVGGFGGAARALADFLCDGVPFSKSVGRGPLGDKSLFQQRVLALAALARCFKSARTRRDLGNGLDWKENRSLMRTMDGARIVALIDKGLGVVRGR